MVIIGRMMSLSMRVEDTIQTGNRTTEKSVSEFWCSALVSTMDRLNVEFLPSDFDTTYIPWARCWAVAQRMERERSDLRPNAQCKLPLLLSDDTKV